MIQFKMEEAKDYKNKLKTHKTQFLK